MIGKANTIFEIRRHILSSFRWDSNKLRTRSQIYTKVQHYGRDYLLATSWLAVSSSNEPRPAFPMHTERREITA